MSISSSTNATESDGGLKDLKSFTCFLRLPREIRLQIWEEIAKDPRNVDIWVCATQDKTRNEESRRQAQYRFVTSQPPPALLHVNREARDISLQFYCLDFGTTGGSSDPRCSPHIYVNFGNDIICPLGVYQTAPRDDFCSHPIRHLAINVYEQSGLYLLHDWEENVFDQIKDIEDIGMYWMNNWYSGKILRSCFDEFDPDTSKLDPEFNPRARLLLELRDYGELESENNFYGRGPKFQRVLHKFDYKLRMHMKERQKRTRNAWLAAEKRGLADAIGEMQLSSNPALVWSSPQLKWMRVKVSLDSGIRDVNEDPVILENHWRKG